MPKGCCVAGCTANSIKNRGLKFHVIPLSGPRREEWLRAISRCEVGADGSLNRDKLWEPRTNYTYVCGRHFITGEKSNDQTEPDYVPSIFPTTSDSKVKFKMNAFSNNENTNEPVERREVQQWENPIEAKVPAIKQEDDEDTQIQQVLAAEVKKEEVEVKKEEVEVKKEEAEIVVTLEPEYVAVAMETSHLKDHNYCMDFNKVKEKIQDWMIPLTEDYQNNLEAPHVERELCIFPKRSKSKSKVVPKGENDKGLSLKPQSSVVPKGLRSKRRSSAFPKGENDKCLICKVRHVQTCQAKQPHKCTFQFCRKSFSQAAKLKSHMMEHTGEKPFQCVECGKRLMTKSSLNSHIKTKHSVEGQLKPFSCSVCKTGFWTEIKLKTHMYQHTGRRAYECSYCDQHFKRKYKLEHHKLQHIIKF